MLFGVGIIRGGTGRFHTADGETYTYRNGTFEKEDEWTSTSESQTCNRKSKR